MYLQRSHLRRRLSCTRGRATTPAPTRTWRLQTDGRQCATNISCCSRTCFKPAPPPGRSRAMFGQCCTPTTCTAQGKNCGTIPDVTAGHAQLWDLHGAADLRRRAHAERLWLHAGYDVPRWRQLRLRVGRVRRHPELRVLHGAQHLRRGGTPNVCGCTPATTCPAGDNCGTVADGCGATLDCGTCTPPDTCGGGGVSNQCGCTPTTCGPATAG